MLYLLLQATRDWLVAHGFYRYVSVLDQIQFRALAAAGLAFLLVLLLGRPTIAWLLRKKIGDTGQTDAEALRRHAASRANVPTMGGLLICGVILGCTLLLADIGRFYVQLGMVVLVWLAAIGGVDDWLKLTARRRGSSGRQGLYSWEKFVFQIGLGVLVGYFAYHHGTPDQGAALGHVLNLPLQKTYAASASGSPGLNPGLVFLGPGAYIVLAALMVAGMSNAVNITDGMDGLAGGISAAVAFGLFALALIAGSQTSAQYLLVPHIPFADELSITAGAMAGACLGFLWWNCSPASVFMGDTGALALGGLIGYIAVITRQEAVVLVMSGVFLWELLTVALQVGWFKISGGKRIFRVAPYHHHLHVGGWTEQQVVARAWIVSVLLVVAGLASIKVR